MRPVCRQCGEPAVIQVALAQGCVVYPQDRQQWLCAQHWDRLTPLGEAEVIEEVGTVEAPNFHGHLNPTRHRTVGSHRAWCDCGEWCYPRLARACACCRAGLADLDPCPACEGTGIKAKEATDAAL